jgi:hypothetical protein
MILEVKGACCDDPLGSFDCIFWPIAKICLSWKELELTTLSRESFQVILRLILRSTAMDLYKSYRGRFMHVCYLKRSCSLSSQSDRESVDLHPSLIMCFCLSSGLLKSDQNICAANDRRPSRSKCGLIWMENFSFPLHVMIRKAWFPYGHNGRKDCVTIFLISRNTTF